MLREGLLAVVENLDDKEMYARRTMRDAAMTCHHLSLSLRECKYVEREIRMS